MEGVDLSQSCFSYMRLSLYDGELAAGSANSGFSFKLFFYSSFARVLVWVLRAESFVRIHRLLEHAG